MGLTDLLLYLREVILQDPAILMPQSHSSAPISAFAEEEERPSQLATLVQVMPVLADYLESIEARNEARAAEL
ncbi:hypothetical protein VTI28DRAFT_7424 [Corynascus sepedonium]